MQKPPMLLRSPLDFTISHLNIHGLDNNLGCKIQDLEKILISDINILTETWSCTHDKNIPNFLTLEVPPNKLDKKKTGRSSGGTLIYYKQYLQNQIKVIKIHKNYLWIEIDKTVFYNCSNNLRICALYIPPQESKYYSDEIFQDLVDDIIDFSPGNEDLMIIGDFNARTNCLPDHLPATNHTNDDNTVIHNLGHFIKRYNCDNGNPNKHGRNMINLCRSTNLRILNGRKFGDTVGNLTCFSHNGASCVDYALASQSLFDKISLFYVSEQSPLSDHCQITAHLPNKKIVNDTQVKYEWIQPNKKYVWNVESPAKFYNVLNSEKIQLKIGKLRDLFKTDCSPDLISSELTSIFHSAANASLKPKPSKHKESKSSPGKKKWFDSDCRNLKKELNSFSKQKHRDPFNELARIKYRDKLKQYKCLLHLKRQNFWDKQITKLQSSLHNDNFWNTWKDFDEQIKKESIAIQDGMIWENYYKKLYSSDKSANTHCSANENSNNATLNDKIETKELIDTISKLKNKKAAGFDGISNEMIKNCNPEMIEMIKMTLNLTLSKGLVPKAWCQGLITPIYKKGCKTNPDNYRGICVGNALLKLLCLLLNNRLKLYLREENIIHNNQIGFEEKCRTTDHLLTLKALINKHVHDTSKKKVHAAFIDFRKAFDTVWHCGLFQKLQNYGIDGNFLNTIKCIYDRTECAVKINNQCTNFFKCSKGVRQGCPLSPTLFNLYINDLIDELNKTNPTPLDLGHEPITCLVYADDLIILSSSHDGLQQCLNSLSKYCHQWKLEVNNDKSKCMTFYKNNTKYKQNFNINNSPLENVTEFTYLGITINAACNFKDTLSTLSSKANRALLALNSRYKIKSLPIKAALKLFDSTIAPILLYGSEVWGPYLNRNQNFWDNSEVERMHTQFLKRLLGVNRSTTNALVRGELGRYPLSIPLNCRTNSFIKHILNESKPHSLVSQALEYENSVNHRPTIASYVNNLNDDLKKNELNTDSFTSLTKHATREALIQSHQIQWTNNLNHCPKALSYKTYKSQITYENYLSLIASRSHRRILSKLRLSDHCLAIEKGRHFKPPLEREKRFCKSCQNTVENETHFILSCQKYASERTMFLNIAQNLCPNFINIPTDEQKLIYLMSNEDELLLQTFSAFLHDIYTKRLTLENNEQ